MNRKKRIYIAGKVTGLPRHQYLAKFRAAENYLASKAWQVINPTLIIDADANWDDAMKICFEAIADCDAIYMLHDYADSRGAVLELAKARELQLTVLYQSAEEKIHPAGEYTSSAYAHFLNENRP